MATCSSSTFKVHTLITGPPGVGKTTLVRGVVSHLCQQDNLCLQGFYTEDVRHGGRGPRIGFDVVTLDGQRSALARVRDEHAHHHGPTVGKYSVDLASFESTALPTLVISPDTPTSSRKTTVVVIDEIGKMELFSKSFSSAVRNVFRLEGVVILATIPIARGKPLPLVEELRKNEKCTVIEVTESNRNSLVQKVIENILKAGRNLIAR